MATKFIEPGGDATFDLSIFSGANNFACTVVSDFTHGSHVKSIRVPNSTSRVTQENCIQDSGARISAYVYFTAFPAGTSQIFSCTDSGITDFIFSTCIDSSGRVFVGKTISNTQIGSLGATLSLNTWYRISLAYTVTSTTINRIEVFVDGASSISITNATLDLTGTNTVWFTNQGGTSCDYRLSDIYIDDSNSLTDTGNIWVTAKRPNSNGTTNGFTTQIGSGGSGYGSGHSPQVNEQPLSTTNGWSMVGSGSAVTEEYNIESKSTGDIDISSATIVDYVGWVYAKSLVSETASIIVGGTSSNISLTNTNTMFTKIKGSSTYPAGTGTDIGIITDTTLTTVSLYECGIIVAYIPASINGTGSLSWLKA